MENEKYIFRSFYRFTRTALSKNPRKSPITCAKIAFIYWISTQMNCICLTSVSDLMLLAQKSSEILHYTSFYYTIFDYRKGFVPGKEELNWETFQESWKYYKLINVHSLKF